jgi:hypothetical protein
MQGKAFLIFADVPPDPDEKGLALYRAAGFDTYLFTEDHICIDDGREAYAAAIRRTEKAGLNAMLRGLNDGNAEPLYYDKKFAGFDLGAFSNLTSFYAVDEPVAGHYDGLARCCVPFANRYPDKLWHINLFPSYAHGSLGTRDDERGTAYENYVRLYAEKVLSRVKGPKTVGFDHYPLFGKGGRYYLSDTWLSDLMICALTARENGCRLSACVQAFSDWEDGWRRLTGPDEIRFQMYTDLAFGADMFEFFLYLPLAGLYGSVPMVKGGEPTPVYGWAQTAIAEIRALEKDYFGLEWLGAATVAGGENRPDLPSAEYLHCEWNGTLSLGSEKRDGRNPAFAAIADKTIDVTRVVPGLSGIRAGRDLLIGAFRRVEGGGALLLVNFADPALRLPCAVELRTERVVECLLRGERRRLASERGAIRLTLNPGDGALVTFP